MDLVDGTSLLTRLVNERARRGLEVWGRRPLESLPVTNDGFRRLSDELAHGTLKEIHGKVLNACKLRAVVLYTKMARRKPQRSPASRLPAL